ncbi:hypothetical protein PUN28_004731 [Cardiocondyla obscurior]|uniref:Secreted protein n=1 Tax=Cardiocondyla obscurior TaxID=286306 RepID=A0AAW2GE65_9HYME
MYLNRYLFFCRVLVYCCIYATFARLPKSPGKPVLAASDSERTPRGRNAEGRCRRVHLLRKGLRYTRQYPILRDNWHSGLNFHPRLSSPRRKERRGNDIGVRTAVASYSPSLIGIDVFALILGYFSRLKYSPRAIGAHASPGLSP